MKKLRFIFLAVIILATMIAFSVCANAAVIASGNCGENGDNVKWSLDDNGTLTIYGSGKIRDVDGVYSSPFFDYSDRGLGADVKHVVIKEGVTEIGEGAFACMFGLKSVTMADSVVKIGMASFYNCTDLQNVHLSKNVTEIAPYAFCMSAIKSIELPEGIKEIHEGAFSGCDFESVVIPEGVTTIGIGAFSYCRNLESVILPESLTTIENRSFEYCDNLKSISLPSGIQSIGETALGTIPGIVGPGVTIVDGIVFTKDMKTLLKYPSSKPEESYTLPDCVETVASFAFYNCKNLISLKLNEGLICIETNAFDGCSNIKEMTIPASVTDTACGESPRDISPNSVGFQTGIGSRIEILYSFEGLQLNTIYVCGMETNVFKGSSPAKNVYIIEGSVADKMVHDYTGTISVLWDYKTPASIHYFTPHTHSYTSEVTKAATCTSVGSKKFTCSCGDTYTETIAKLPHESDNWTILIPAKAGTEGVECGLCKVCGVVAMRSIEALPKDRPVFRLTPAKTESGYAVTLSLENNVNGFYSLGIIVKYDSEKLVCVKADTSNAIAKFEAANTSDTIFINYADTAYMPNKGELCTMYFEPNGDLLSGSTEVVINTVVSDKPYTTVNCNIDFETYETTTVTMTIGQAAGIVNNRAYLLDASPIIRNDRTMLPVRFVAEAFGAEVGWDGATSTATLKTEDTEIKITIGASTAIVNGEDVTLDSPAFIENSRTYLPVRFVAENLGASVAWNGITSTATLTK